MGLHLREREIFEITGLLRQQSAYKSGSTLGANRKTLFHKKGASLHRIHITTSAHQRMDLHLRKREIFEIKGS